CGQNSEPSNGSENENTGDETKGEGDSSTLVIAQPNDIPTMDPLDSLGTAGDRVFRNMYSRMFYWDQNMELQQDAVEDYEQVDDETCVFTLKEDITFHNGDPLTAEDVAFSLGRVMTDESLKEFPYFKQLKEVNAVDELEVEIITDGPMPTLL